MFLIFLTEKVSGMHSMESCKVTTFQQEVLQIYYFCWTWNTSFKRSDPQQNGANEKEFVFCSILSVFQAVCSDNFLQLDHCLFDKKLEWC